jgi:hypothetical protein
MPAAKSGRNVGVEVRTVGGQSRSSAAHDHARPSAAVAAQIWFWVKTAKAGSAARSTSRGSPVPWRIRKAPASASQ